MAADAEPFASLVDPDARRASAPGRHARRDPRLVPTQPGSPRRRHEGELVRCAWKAWRSSTAWCWSWLEELSGETVEVIHIVGGGTPERAAQPVHRECLRSPGRRRPGRSDGDRATCWCRPAQPERLGRSPRCERSCGRRVNSGDTNRRMARRGTRRTSGLRESYGADGTGRSRLETILPARRPVGPVLDLRYNTHLSKSASRAMERTAGKGRRTGRRASPARHILMNTIRVVRVCQLSAILAVWFFADGLQAATIIHAGRLIDGRERPAATEMFDRHRGRPHHAYRRRLRRSRQPGDKLIRLTDHTVMPGLMDMHTHLHVAALEGFVHRAVLHGAGRLRAAFDGLRPSHADGRIHDRPRPGRQRRQLDRAAQGDRQGLGSRAADFHRRQVARDDRRACRSDQCAARRLSHAIPGRSKG